MLPKPSIEVCFTPKLFEYRLTTENYIVVIVDILRATSAICSAFQNGAEGIIPVAKVEDAVEYKKKGFLVAGERNGVVIEGADFGNSPFNFTAKNVKGKTIALTTTNGTQAIEMSKSAESIVIGAFSNITPLTEWLSLQQKNVVILCAGWKYKFNLEDSVFAGALTERLLDTGKFITDCDSAMAALDLWAAAQANLLAYIRKSSHFARLQKMGLDNCIPWCLEMDTTHVLPLLKNGVLKNELQI